MGQVKPRGQSSSPNFPAHDVQFLERQQPAELMLSDEHSKPLPTRLFAGEKRSILRFCSIVASVSGVSGAGGGRVKVLPGTPGSGAGSCLLLFFAHKAFFGTMILLPPGAARDNRGGGAARVPACRSFLRTGIFWRVWLFGTIRGPEGAEKLGPMAGQTAHKRRGCAGQDCIKRNWPTCRRGRGHGRGPKSWGRSALKPHTNGAGKFAAEMAVFRKVLPGVSSRDTTLKPPLF